MSWSSIHAKYFINIVHQVAACLVLGGGPDPLKKRKLIKVMQQQLFLAAVPDNEPMHIHFLALLLGNNIY